jgi:hypothetical protein
LRTAGSVEARSSVAQAAQQENLHDPNSVPRQQDATEKQARACVAEARHCVELGTAQARACHETAREHQEAHACFTAMTHLSADRFVYPKSFCYDTRAPRVDYRCNDRRASCV